MNISIGRSSTRLKEIGSRKVYGAVRLQLIKQFLGESTILCILSLLLGFALAEIFLPVFCSLSNTELSVGSAFNLTAIPAVFTLILVVSFISGGYPAFYLSGFRPVEIMKGRFRIGGSNYFTKSLVTMQFSLSVFLIICVLIMSNQMSFMKNKNLGFDSEQVVVIVTNSDDGDKLTVRLREKLTGNNSLLHLAGAGESLGRQNSYSMTTVDSDVSQPFTYVFKVDEKFIPTTGMELVAGRNFSREFPSDAVKSVIVNEAFIEKFKIENPIGDEIKTYLTRSEDNAVVIAGVVKNFHFLSMHSAVDPALLHMSNEWPVKYILTRIRSEDITGILSTLQSAWTEIAPGLPFDYYFLDDDFNMQYSSEEKWEAIIRYSTFFAVFIAGIGLFGLTALALSRRTKEIGIRKVLGASSSKIAGLVNSEFLALILLSNFIAWPAAYYIMNRWLQNFAYRISIGWEIFMFGAVSALVIGLVTVSYHSFKAANSNPVDAIRYE
jgi:putative ABC transport system permease protein